VRMTHLIFGLTRRDETRSWAFSKLVVPSNWLGTVLAVENPYSLSSQENQMNEDQVKGTAKNIGGKVQEAAGKVTGSVATEAEGKGKQIEGKTQRAVGDAKEALKDSTKP